MHKRILLLTAILLSILPTLLVQAPSVMAWASYGPNEHHEDMTRDALTSIQELGWDKEIIDNISDYSRVLDCVEVSCDQSLWLLDCNWTGNTFSHRVKFYQDKLDSYITDDKKCSARGAEVAAAFHLSDARYYYQLYLQNPQKWQDSWQRELGYAIHYIQDALCPAHVFPFDEGGTFCCN